MISNTVFLTSPVSPIKVRGFTAEIDYSEFKHDYLRLALANPGLQPNNPYVTGLPVEVNWNEGSRFGGVFYGYIDRLETDYSKIGTSIGSSVMHLICVGATYALKHNDYQTFYNRTADSVVKEIVSNAGLACIAAPHPVVWSTLAQMGKSGWKFCNDLAHRIGYSLFSIDTTVYFVDRRDVNRYLRNIPAYTLTSRPQLPHHFITFDYQASSGDGVRGNVPGAHFVHGTSAATGVGFTVESVNEVHYGTRQVFTPAFSRSAGDYAPSTLQEAEAYIDGAQANNVFTMFAEAAVMGNPRLRAGGLIDVAVTDGNPLFEGTWFITKAYHHVVGQAYTTHLELATDAHGTIQTMNRTVFDPKKGLRTPPPTLARGAQWTAQWGLP